MNLQKLNVQEMQVEELKETHGGSLWDTYWDIVGDPASWGWLLSISGVPSSYIDSL